MTRAPAITLASRAQQKSRVNCCLLFFHYCLCIPPTSSHVREEGSVERKRVGCRILLPNKSHNRIRFTYLLLLTGLFRYLSRSEKSTGHTVGSQKCCIPPLVLQRSGPSSQLRKLANQRKSGPLLAMKENRLM